MSCKSNPVHLLKHRENSGHVFVEASHQVARLFRGAAGLVDHYLVIAVPTSKQGEQHISMNGMLASFGSVRN